jgi:Protein of unknown function (DUF1275)
MSNAQTANLVLLWVHGVAGHWEEAPHFLFPMVAFAPGIVMASLLRRIAKNGAGAITMLIEIALLIVIGILHNRLPDVAGTLGISFVAAMRRQFRPGRRASLVRHVWRSLFGFRGWCSRPRLGNQERAGPDARYSSCRAADRPAS